MADALSHLPLISDTPHKESHYTLAKLAECFATALDPTSITFPLKFQVIEKYQQADKTLEASQHHICNSELVKFLCSDKYLSNF